MTSRPAAPVSETPEVDAMPVEWTVRRNGVPTEYVSKESARSLERRLSLAQTELKGHMRVEDELRATLAASEEFGSREHSRLLEALNRNLEAQARIAELEKYDERYTWLVGRLFERSLHFQGIGSAIQLCAANGDVLGSGAGADAAIDAALKSRA